jgi:hypothetical protein
MYARTCLFCQVQQNGTGLENCLRLAIRGGIIHCTVQHHSAQFALTGTPHKARRFEYEVGPSRLARAYVRTDRGYFGIRADSLELFCELVNVAANVDRLERVRQVHFCERDRDFLPCAPEQ